MSPKVAELVVDDPEIKQLMEITRDDIVSVAVSQEEEKLETRRMELDNKLKNLREDLGKAMKKYQDGCRTATNAAAKTNLSAVKVFLSKYGIQATAKVDEGKDDLKNRELSYLITITHGSSYNSRELETKSFTVKMSKSLAALCCNVESLGKKVADTEEVAIKLRRSIAQLPVYERKVKAKLAEVALQGSKKGRIILSKISGVKALPQL